MLPPRTPTHSGLEQRLLTRLKKFHARGETIIVGFSGGADSLALASALARVAPLTGASIILVHVDHQLRAEASADAHSAADLAAALGLPLHLHTSSDHPTTLFPGVGVEEAARRVRYVAFARAARDLAASAVALAHHRDDQAETVLLHLMRGAGLTGASGMAEISSLPVPWWETCQDQSTIRLWRPLLSESRETVRAYTHSTGLTPIEDPSNHDRQFTRNRVRHEVLPLLESITPNVRTTLSRYASIAATEDQLLDQIATAIFRRLVTTADNLTIASLREEPRPIQRRVVRHWFQQAGVTSELTLERLEATLDLAERRRGGTKIELGDGWSVESRHGILRVQNDLAGRRTEKESTDTANPTQEDE